MIWGERKQEYFCEGGWTENSPTGKSLAPDLVVSTWHVGWAEPCETHHFHELQSMGIASDFAQ